MPSKILPARASLEHLKYQARDLLKLALNGERAALASMREFHPEFAAKTDQVLRAAEIKLADAQLVIAREYGFASWAKLKAHVESLQARAVEADVSRSSVQVSESVIRAFLEYACPDHHIRGGHSHAIARNTAQRLLEQHPGLRRANFHTAVVCGEIEEVRRLLAENPAAAKAPYDAADARDERSGPGEAGALFEEHGLKRWDPLLFLCFTRLPLRAVNENAVAIAELLLHNGANPNAYFKAGDSFYTPLVGAIGEGEENRPPHPQRDGLVKLLLARGANPYDMQVIYNIHFQARMLWFLEMIHAQSVKDGREADWADPSWAMLDMGVYGNGARFLLSVAVRHNDLELAEWILTHGADSNAPSPKSPLVAQGPLFAEALRNGYREMAELLARSGAASGFELSGEERFIAACLSGKREEAEELARIHPEYLRSPKAFWRAAESDNVEAVRLLLDLGVSPNVQNPRSGQQTALHTAAWCNAARVVALLIERGAAVDTRDRSYNATPLGFAIYNNSHETVEVLLEHTRDIWNLAFLGKLERLRALLSGEPALAKAVNRDGATPLMSLSGDETVAQEIAGLLLAQGADAKARNSAGETAVSLARKRGQNRLAEFLETVA